MNHSPKLSLVAVALGLCLAAGGAMAQDAAAQMPPAASSSANHSGSRMMHSKGMQGRVNDSIHQMMGTVTATDPKTGVVEVDTAGLQLKVHFPPPSMAKLKAGDKIALNLSYRMQHCDRAMANSSCT